MLRLNLKIRQPLILLQQCHLFARFLLVFLLLTMTVARPNYSNGDRISENNNSHLKSSNEVAILRENVKQNVDASWTATTVYPSHPLMALAAGSSSSSSLRWWRRSLPISMPKSDPAATVQLQRAPRSASEPYLQQHTHTPTDLPEFHLLPDDAKSHRLPATSVDSGVIDGLILWRNVRTDSEESWINREDPNWRIKLDVGSVEDVNNAAEEQLSTNKNKGDNVTRTRSDYNKEGDIKVMGGASEIGLAPGLIPGRNQRSAAADPSPVAVAPAVAVTGELDESTVRNERSTNLSHITGTARKIQMFVKNRHLQILPDGTVNGTSDDTSDYTILQRSSVNTGELQIQGVATCLFLCMDTCGLLYGAMQFTEECIFRENIEQDHYNTYSSVRHSDSRKTLYLALDGRGVPRKVQVTAARQKRQQMLQLAAGGGSSSSGSLGKLSTYARVLTRHVHNSRVEELARRILIERQRQQLTIGNSTESVENLSGAGIFSQGFRHHGYNHLCPVSPSFVNLPPTTSKSAARCTKRGKGGLKNNQQGGGKKGQINKRKKRKRKCIDEEDADKCRRERKKRKNSKSKKGDGVLKVAGPKRNKNQPNQQRSALKKQTERTSSAFSSTTTISSDTASD